MNRTFTLAAALLAVLCLATPTAAQTLVGTIAGKVMDEQGAVLPGATVTLTGKTGQTTTVTDAEGNYRFPALDPGTYTVQVTMPSFATQEERDIVVGIGRELAVNFSLKVGGLQERIEVTANASVVDVSSSTTDNKLSQDLLFTIPIDRANAAVNIMNNTPGVNSGSAYGGSAGSANALLVDGVDVRDPEGGTAWVFFNYNIMEEVQVTGLGATAEYGGFTGAVVNTISKSGGNALSGLFEMRYTNDSLASSNVDADLIAQNQSLGSPNVQKKLTDYTVQLGGPIKKDKAFFFLSVQRYSIQEDPAGARTLRTEVSPRFNTKVTWSPTFNDTITGLFQYHQYNQTGRSGLPGAINSTDIQTVEQDSPEFVWNGQYRKLFSSSTFLEAKFTGYWGYFDLDPINTAPAHFDGETGSYTTGGGGYNAKYDRERNQLNVALSHYADAYGRHSFKFGVEIERSKVRNRFAYSDGVYFYDYGGVPLYAYGYSYDIDAGNQRESFYAQDSWKFGRVTANLGVRLDRIRGTSVELDETLYSNTNIGPRLGVAVDLTGTGASVLRGFWGRYYDGPVASTFNRAVIGTSPFFTYEVLPNGSLLLIDESPPLVYSIAADIEHPGVDDFNVSFEQQLRRDLRFSVTGIWRNNFNFVNSVVQGARYAPVTLTNDLTRGTFTGYRWANQAATEDNYFIQNVDGFQYFDTSGNLIGVVDAKRNYQGVMFVLSKAYTNRWAAQASYVYSKSEGTISNTSQATLQSRQFENPNVGIINTDGRSANDPTHEFKFYANYTVPKVEVGLGLYYRGVSGPTYTPFQQYTNGQLAFPFSAGRQIFLEPRGSRRNDFRNLADLRIEKLFGSVTRYGDRFGIYADVVNLFNAGVVTSRQSRVPSVTVTGFPNPVLFGSPSAVTPGRQITLGGRWSF